MRSLSVCFNVALTLFSLQPSALSSISRDLCINLKGNRMCLLWECGNNQSLHACATQFVGALCTTSSVATDPTVLRCCSSQDEVCRNQLIDNTYETLQQTAKAELQDFEQAFQDVYNNNVWGNADLTDGGPNFYSGDGANASKCRKLIEYTNDLVVGQRVVEMGCGDMRVASHLNFAQVTSYICVDVAPIAVEEAQRVLNEKCGDERDIYDNLKCRAIQGNGAASLPIGDILIAKDVLMHWPTSMIANFSKTTIPQFQKSLLTFNTPMKVVKRLDIIPGEAAAVSIDDLYLPNALVKWQVVLSNVCEDFTKSTYF